MSPRAQHRAGGDAARLGVVGPWGVMTTLPTSRTWPRRLTLGAAALGLLLAVGACYSGGPSIPPDAGVSLKPGPDAGPTPVNDAGLASDAGLPAKGACSVLVARRCDYLARCGLLASAGGVGDCERWLLDTWCGPSLWSSRVEGSVATLRYDPVRALACADAFLTRDCAAWTQEPDPCTRFLLPAAQPRQACYGTYTECVEGVCRGATCPRSCLPRGLAGEVCQETPDCRAGLYCRPTSSPGVGTCTPYGTAQQPCSPLAPCSTGLTCLLGQCVVLPGEGELCPGLKCDETTWCAGGADGGVCQLRRNRGAPCVEDAECLQGDLCEELSGLCASPQVTQSGAPCGPRQQCPTGTACLGLSATSPGACVAPGRLGAPCRSWAECSDDLTCLEGDGGRSCGPRGQAGTPCVTDRACAALHGCLGQVCAPLPLPGSPCAPGLRCLYGACVLGADGGLICGGPQGPGVSCRQGGECASGRCDQNQCLAACAP